MANCLVTKLNGVVQNNNLQVLGTLHIHINQGDGIMTIPNLSKDQRVGLVMYTSDGGTHIRCTGEGYPDFVSRMEAYTPNGGFSNIEVDRSVAFDLVLEDKYRLSNFMMSGVGDGAVLSLSDIKYCDTRVIDCNYMHYLKGNLSDLSACIGLTNFQFLDSQIEGDISSMAGNTNLVYFKTNGRVTGNVSSLGTLIHLEELFFYNNTNVSGSIESILEGMLRNGKTNNLRITLTYGTKVTFHGSSSVLEYNVTFGSGTITVKDGNTVVGTYNGTAWSYPS